MTRKYEPRQYWNRRLAESFNLRGVGNIGFSEGYNKWLYRRKERCIEASLRDVTITDRRVLDIGCGTGFFVQWYRERGAFVCGLDITQASVERLTRQFGGEFYVQDIADPRYEPHGLFDFVNVWDVLYHIVSPAGFQQAIQNIAKSLKPGGLLLVTDWLAGSNDVRIADHVQARCLATYRQVLPEHFEEREVYPLYRFLNRPTFGWLDDYLGWLYFLLDSAVTDLRDDSIALGVWRYRQ